MDTETLTVLQKGEDFEIIVEHDQSGSAYGITLSKNAYEQLRQHFVGSSALQFTDDMFKLINAYAKNGLSKPDLVSAMEWMTGSCKMS